MTLPPVAEVGGTGCPPGDAAPAPAEIGGNDAPSGRLLVGPELNLTGSGVCQPAAVAEQQEYTAIGEVTGQRSVQSSQGGLCGGRQNPVRLMAGYRW